MRDFKPVRFDRRDFEYLSKESLWSAVESINFSANYEMIKSNGFAEDYWRKELSQRARKYEFLLLDLCKSKKLTPFDKSGRNGKILTLAECTCPSSIEDENGYTVGHEDVIDLDVFFYKIELLKCLREQEIYVDENNLWSAVEKKEKVLRPEQETRLIIQGIGIALRAASPDMTLADMARHELVLKNGGSVYPGKNTVRGWLSEVDDRSPDQKTGPKPKTP